MTGVSMFIAKNFEFFRLILPLLSPFPFHFCFLSRLFPFTGVFTSPSSSSLVLFHFILAYDLCLSSLPKHEFFIHLLSKLIRTKSDLLMELHELERNVSPNQLFHVKMKRICTHRTIT